MKCFLLIFTLLALSVVTLWGQSNNLIKELEEKHKTLQKEIVQTESLLNNTKKDVTNQLNVLNTLTGQIRVRKQYISTISNDLYTIENELNKLTVQLRELRKDLATKKKNYEASVQYLYKNKTIEEKLMFIFATEDLRQTYRRLRYVREYATYQRLQGEDILQKQEQVKRKASELAEAKSVQNTLLSESEQEKEKLEQQEQQKRRLINSLQGKQKGLQNEIDKKKREAVQLNARIDKIVIEEMERVRKRADKSSNSSKKGQKAMDKADHAASQDFASQRGKLPMPITGTSIIVSQYGQYNVQGLKSVKLDNKGVDIQGQPGANARAVFDGKVVAVFQLNRLFNILIRHGNYISVYCNLSSTSVQQGEDVKAEQLLGKVFSDPNNSKRTLLHFQLRVEKEKLNPEEWLRHL
ncbi:Murein hydrolase activator EnvC [termite gut metagenome]|uniref:Murein hydrolase activator EnvC n=1 Tax=termite gut metagenome TaxID=433724 RepID=A0A5J4T102_9ZZZZ